MLQTRFQPTFIPRMVTVTKVKCQGPSQLFLYSNRTNFWPYNFLTDPKNKMIVDDVNISSTDFVYLLACRRSILIYRSGQHIYAKGNHSDRFCRQLGYNQ